MWKNLPSGQMMFFGLSASGWAAYSVQTINMKYGRTIVPTDGRRLFNVQFRCSFNDTKYSMCITISCKHVVTM